MTKKSAPKKKKTTTRKSTAKKAVMKKTAGKKTTAKKDLHKKAKSTPFKSKLGHDPLAWISGDDAADLGISFDDIEANVEQTLDELEQIIPSVSTEPVIDDVTTDETESSALEPAIETKSSKPVEEPTEETANQGWGLFDDEPESEPVIEVPAEPEKAAEVVSDDGSWGLFGDDEPQPPVGEGVAWGLFADEDDVTVDHDAVEIRLPSTFSVSEISKIYHDIDLKIHENHDMILDASEVELIDAAGLQLLFSVQIELKKHDCKLVIKDASDNIEALSNSSLIREIVGVSA